MNSNDCSRPELTQHTKEVAIDISVINMCRFAKLLDKIYLTLLRALLPFTYFCSPPLRLGFATLLAFIVPHDRSRCETGYFLRSSSSSSFNWFEPSLFLSWCSWSCCCYCCTFLSPLVLLSCLYSFSSFDCYLNSSTTPSHFSQSPSHPLSPSPLPLSASSLLPSLPSFYLKHFRLLRLVLVRCFLIHFFVSDFSSSSFLFHASFLSPMLLSSSFLLLPLFTYILNLKKNATSFLSFFFNNS